MIEDHLWAWMVAAMRGNSPDPVLWEKVVGILQGAIHKGHLAEDCTWHTIVLIQNGNGRYF